jgi:hypothetical protein
MTFIAHLPEGTVKKSVVDGYLVSEKDDPQSSPASLRNSLPASYSAVRLNGFMLWIADHTVDPLVLNNTPVGPPADMPKVCRGRMVEHRREPLLTGSIRMYIFFASRP